MLSYLSLIHVCLLIMSSYQARRNLPLISVIIFGRAARFLLRSKSTKQDSSLEKISSLMLLSRTDVESLWRNVLLDCIWWVGSFFGVFGVFCQLNQSTWS